MWGATQPLPLNVLYVFEHQIWVIAYLDVHRACALTYTYILTYGCNVFVCIYAFAFTHVYKTPALPHTHTHTHSHTHTHTHTQNTHVPDSILNLQLHADRTLCTHLYALYP
jgi:urea transporter